MASTLQSDALMISAPYRLLTALRHARPVRAASPWAWTLRDAIRIRWAARHGPDEFDRTHGVRTRVVPSVGEFARTFFHGGVEHEPIPSARFREVFDELDLDLSETVFVDYGSGAGRAVLLAATYPFKEVVGVELSPSLHAQAEANLEAFPSHLRRAGGIRLVCGDAMALAPPSDPAVLYFYNPFGAGVMRTVLAAIEASLARTPREVTLVLAYCYKAPRAVVEGSAFFRPVSADRGIAILRSVTPAPVRSTA
jgi:SAM-dependent methyltransferase